MSPSVLGSVTLGYEPVWNQWRQRTGVRLFVEPESDTAVDAKHLLASLAELWPLGREAQILSVGSPGLLADLLEHVPADSVWLEVPDAWLSDAQLVNKVRSAKAHGVRLMWRGEPGDLPTPTRQEWFNKTLRALSPHQALAALRVVLRQQKEGGDAAADRAASPVAPGAIYEGLASQALVEHALDNQSAWGVAGWPAEEMLYGYRLQQIQPSRAVILALIKAIDADESTENLEHRLGSEPLLTYRLLRYVNSPSLALRSEVDNVRQALMNIGYSRFRQWLMEQMPRASSDPNLDPIRAGMVLRGRIMEHLADAGAEDELRREVFLCGIFSQVDMLLGESLGTAIHRLPLPGRVASAILGQTGPYAPWLEVAAALESGSTKVIREVSRAHGIATDEVNRSLLRALAGHA